MESESYQIMDNIEHFGNPQPPPTVKVLFDDICEFIKDERLRVQFAAELAGGWEGWLQAALAVHLNEHSESSRYVVEREANVYTTNPEAKEYYKKLRGTLKKASVDQIKANRSLRADLAVKTRGANPEHIVIELKCESRGMSELAKLIVKEGSPDTKAQRDGITSNYITLGVTHDAMKLDLGFNPNMRVDRACLCAVAYSKAGADQLKWLKKGDHGYVYELEGTDITVCMWHVAVNGNGLWVDDGHAPGALVDLLKFQSDVVQNAHTMDVDVQETVFME